MVSVRRILEEQLPNDLGSQQPSSTLHTLSVSDIPKNEHLVFSTSGSTGDEKTNAPLKRDNLERYHDLNAEAFSLAGINEDDVALNLGAPLPHASGWAIEVGMKRAGAGTANECYEDFFGSIDIDKSLMFSPEEVTSIITLPRVALRAGKSLESKEGEAAQDIFPNLNIGIFSGDVVNAAVRAKLKSLFGFDKVVEAYAASECGFIATGVGESSQMIPLFNRYIFEIIPDTATETRASSLVDIRDLNQPTIGDLALTDPFREAFDFTRYLIGDKVKVYPEDVSKSEFDIPTIEFMGRNDEVLNFGGANVHENQLDTAIDAVYAHAGEWAVNSVESPDSEGVIIDLYVENPDQFQIEEFRNTLSQQVPALKEAIRLGVVEDININDIAMYDDTGEMKFDRMNI